MAMATRRTRRDLRQIQRERRYFADARSMHIKNIIGALLFVMFFTLFQSCEARADALYDIHIPEPPTIEEC